MSMIEATNRRNLAGVGERRRAQARRVFDRRARPLPDRWRRGRCGAAPARSGAVVELRSGDPAVSPRAPRARHRGPARHGAAAAVRRTPRAGARLDRRRAAPYRQAPRRRRLFPFRQSCAAHAASRRHKPQRSRQGAKLALRRRPRLSHRFPARHLLPPQQRAVPYRALRGFAPSAQAQTPLRARCAHGRRTPRARAQELDHAGMDGDRQEGLLRHHARPELHRPRGPRPAFRLRGARHRRTAAHTSAGARRRHRAFPDRRAGTGLYAFVEGSASDRELRDFLGAKGPEHLQVVDALPRKRRARCAAKSCSSSP